MIHRFSLRNAARCNSAAIVTAFLQCPAFLSSCTEPGEAVVPARVEAQIYLQVTKNPTPATVDLFFFEPDGAQNLDAYQQAELSLGGSAVYGLSGAGPRRLVALSGLSSTRRDWYDIRNYGSLSKYTFSLEDDSPAAPLLVGETDIPDGASRRVSLTLHPMLSCIRIRSVCADFTGRSYAGQAFHNDQIYLSYAGTECFPVGGGDRLPVSWANAGALDSASVARFPHPEFLVQEGVGDIGPGRRYPECRLYCYPHPDLRLVLSGRVMGEMCYYPIPLNGLEPGTEYALDITLYRMGTPDPETPAEPGVFDADAGTLPWEKWPAYDELY